MTSFDILPNMRIESGLDVVRGIIDGKRINLPPIDISQANEKPKELSNFEKDAIENRRIIEETGVVKLFEGIRDANLVTRFSGENTAKADIIWGHKNSHITLAFNIKYIRSKGSYSQPYSYLYFQGISLAIVRGSRWDEERRLAILTGKHRVRGVCEDDALEHLLHNVDNTDFYIFEKENDIKADIGHIDENANGRRHFFDDTICSFVNEQTNIPEIIGNYIATTLEQK